MKNFFLFLSLFFISASLIGQTSEKVGLGVRLELDSTKGYKIPKIIEVIPNGPAKAAGIKEGDFILEVAETSTRNLKLTKVVELIVGDEGTKVELEIERNGNILQYSIVRKKYQYVESFYQSADKDDAFCTALTTLMNDAGYDFDHTKDSTRYVDDKGAWSRRHYESKVNVPGAVKIEMVGSMGITCQITMGTYRTMDEVNKTGEKLINHLKECFPEYYYEPVLEKDGSKSVEIGKQSTSGFESPILEVLAPEDKSGEGYTLYIYINGGKRTEFFTIKGEPMNNAFPQAIRKIYDDIQYDYSHVKGEKHESSGGFFKSYYYDISPVPNGAHDCTLSSGGLTFEGCNCRFFLGESHEEAVAAFDKVAEAMIQSLGSEFVYVEEAPFLDMYVPSEAEKVKVFGIKKQKGYESMSLVALVLVKSSDNRYGVNMIFHDFGF